MSNDIEKKDIEDLKLSKRPWRVGGEEVSFIHPNGETSKCWVPTVVDANGNRICFGKTKDMEFIVKMENSYDDIVNRLKEHKDFCSKIIQDAAEFKR